MTVMKCRSCRRKLTEEMEIEYSQYLTEYFCSPDCATDAYYEFMGSVPFDVKDEGNDLNEMGIKVMSGKLYDTTF